MRDNVEANAGKFDDPRTTASGKARARVRLSDPQTLWFNTGTLCNLTCTNCYIESSPVNDALVYITADEVSGFLDQLDQRGWKVGEIGFTGGEPFMNPGMIDMAARCLERGYRVLILTNAMAPMMRPGTRAGLDRLRDGFGDRMTLRVSLDHWSAAQHDETRGAGSFARALAGME